MPRAVGALAAAAVALALALAGCGRDGGRSALAEALGYAPADARAVLVAPSDLEAVQLRNFDARLARPLLATTLRRLVEDSAAQAGLSYERDVEPLLGNPLVVAGDGDGFFAALRVREPSRLEPTLRRARLHPAGRIRGARAYAAGSELPVAAAADGDVLVLATDPRTLERAVARRRRGDGLTHQRFSRALAGLPGGAAVRGYGSIPALLAPAEGEGVERLPWLRSLRTYGFALTIRLREVEARLQMLGTGHRVRPRDLPIAPGGRPAPVLNRPAALVAGLRDGRRLLEAASAVVGALAPGSSAAAALADVRAWAAPLLSGPVLWAHAADGRGAGRAPLDDAAAARAAIRRLTRAPGGRVRGPGELYRVRLPGGRAWVVGTIGADAVAGSDARAAAEVAGTPAVRLEETRGGLVFRADLAVSDFGLGVDTGPLGEVVGWAEATPRKTSLTIRAQVRR